MASRIISATKISGRKRNRKLFPSYPYLEEGDNVRAGKRQWRGSVLRCKLLPRATVHINPRLAYCFPDQEEIYTCAFVYVHLYLYTHTHTYLYTQTRTQTHADHPLRRRRRATRRKKRLVEGRAFMPRVHFVLSLWPRMGNAGNRWNEILGYTEPTPDVAEQNMAPRDNAALRKKYPRAMYIYTHLHYSTRCFAALRWTKHFRLYKPRFV